MKQIRASGGGRKSQFWRQIQADVFGQKVVSRSTPRKAPAYGVALLAAVGPGAFRDIVEACDATIRVVEETPRQRWPRQVLRAGVPIYQRLYPVAQKRLQKDCNL